MNISKQQIALIKILFIYYCFCSFNTKAQTVTTLAGSIPGYLDGIGTGAQFNGPAGVAMTADGTLYVADRINHCIRKITSDGVVTTLAGSGVSGFSNGAGIEAEFSFPNGIAVDAKGNVYVADTKNHRIRKITSDGVVTTLAGSEDGYADGLASSALFSYPEAVAVDAAGTVYIGDSSNQAIRKITTAGVVTTLAGIPNKIGYADGPGALAKFWTPSGVAVNADGIVFVSEKQGNRIRKITVDGIVSTLAGNGISGFADGNGIAAMFNAPWNLSLDAIGNVYVADGGNHRIRKITSDGVVTTLAGSTKGYIDGLGSGAKFDYPIGIFSDNDGTVFVGESGGCKIRKITTTLDTNNYLSEKLISIFPNPASSIINFELNNLKLSKITILDMNGRSFELKDISSNENSIYIGNLQNGIYILQLYTDRGIIYKKIIKSQFS